ncbi:reverse transcriptase [Senna tora]|uniref:Reverse transcriptase n=1 Tax=Senna tora TaxID=362788 RepID=A0A835CIW2_9FABA|nr:reverse transcriptase [Senna tora]
MAKLAWHLGKDKDKPCVVIGEGIYNLKSRNASLFGKVILLGKQLIEKGSRMVVISGRNTNFWDQCWCVDYPLRHLISGPLTRNEMDLMVADLANDNGGLIRNHWGNWVASFSKFIGSGSAIEVELIITSLEIVVKHCCMNLIVEVDRKLAISLINDRTLPVSFHQQMQLLRAIDEAVTCHSCHCAAIACQQWTHECGCESKSENSWDEIAAKLEKLIQVMECRYGSTTKTDRMEALVDTNLEILPTIMEHRDVVTTSRMDRLE